MCVDAPEGEILLNNFTKQNADSIIVITYKKNTNTVVDSFFTSAVKGHIDTSSWVVPLRNSLNTTLDYKIRFVSIGKVYLLNNFSNKKAPCNSCFPIGHDYFDALDSYYVNGQKQNVPLQITK